MLNSSGKTLGGGRSNSPQALGRYEKAPSSLWPTASGLPSEYLLGAFSQPPRAGGLSTVYTRVLYPVQVALHCNCAAAEPAKKSLPPKVPFTEYCSDAEITDLVQGCLTDCIQDFFTQVPFIH